MRGFRAALAAGVFAGSAGVALAQSMLGQSQPGGVDNGGAIAVPPPPPIVASPISPPTPAAPVTPVPPGLVPASPPPETPGAADNTNLDNGVSPNGDNGTAQSPASPAGQAPAGQAPAGQADTTQPPAQDVIPTPPNSWQPGKTAQIGVLDKINGGTQEISIPVGGQSVVGDLQVSVQACVVRPPDQVPDAAAFLSLAGTDELSGPPKYRGWLVRSAPGAAMAGDASVVLRIIGCS